MKAYPNETHNLTSDPARSEILTRLRAKLDAWINGEGDRGFASEPGCVEGPQALFPGSD